MTKKKKDGIRVAVSPEAHEKLKTEAFNRKPRLTLRALINTKLGLAKEL